MKTALTSPQRHQTKTQVVCDQLASLAARLGPNGRFPTVNELRNTLGVSLTTLDGALREMEKRGVIYRMHGVGVFVAPAQQKTIGLVYAVRQTYGSPFWDMLVEQMRLRAEAGQERFRIYITHSMPEQPVPLPDDLVQAVNDGQLQGVIFVGDQNKAGAEWLDTQAVPMVTFATPCGTYRVVISRESMVATGIEELVRDGCLRIGMWVPFGTGVRFDQRHKPSGLLDVFAETLRQKNLSFRDEWAWRIHDVLEEPHEAGSYQEQGYRAVQEVYGNKSLAEAPDGLVVLNDLMARGALAGFQELGLRVGQDVKIACQSNKDSNVLLGYESLLTRLQVDSAMLATAIFETLETLMKGDAPSEFLQRIEPIVVRPELVKPILPPLQTRTVSTPLATSF